MANYPSSKKSIKVSNKKRMRNKIHLSKMKKCIKNFILSKDKGSFINAQKMVMKNSSKGLIKINKASRIISNMTKFIKK